MWTMFPQCNFSQEFPEILRQNLICYHSLSVSGNSEVMHCGILINTLYIVLEKERMFYCVQWSVWHWSVKLILAHQQHFHNRPKSRKLLHHILFMLSLTGFVWESRNNTKWDALLWQWCGVSAAARGWYGSAGRPQGYTFQLSLMNFAISFIIASYFVGTVSLPASLQKKNETLYMFYFACISTLSCWGAVMKDCCLVMYFGSRRNQDKTAN